MPSRAVSPCPPRAKIDLDGASEPGTLRFEQGDFIQRPGRVLAEVEFASEGMVGQPRIGGEAVLIMQSTIRI